MDSRERLQQIAKLAVESDRKKDYCVAIKYYIQAVETIDQELQHSSGPSKDIFLSKREEYLQRTELLRFHATLDEALKADSEGQESEAVGLYVKAGEVFLSIRQHFPNKDEVRKLQTLADQAIARAEELRGIKKAQDVDKLKNSGNHSKAAPVPRAKATFGFQDLTLADAPSTSKSIRPVLSEAEKKVIMATSIINGREYLPYIDEFDSKEKFNYSIPFEDKHGKLLLSQKQKTKISSWRRATEFMSNPSVIAVSVDCFSVKQTLVSDCSFVASIAVAAQYEKRFKKQLITSIIYPKNKSGQPIFNPSGKYMIKLRLNGVSRKVIIDDYFPLSTNNEPLCSYSNNKNELWVSLLEKAYMKVMGGYDFPGSNSNIDLHALTGWIPERASIKDKSFDKDKEFRKIMEKFRDGQVLVTVATGDFSESVADKAGLVTCHAYALLDIREVNGVKLLMLKNPWSHLRWKGNYSEHDKRNWTPEMMSALNYDPKNAQNFDNGVFWIDYHSLCNFFDVIYMNWNPKLFPHTYSLHQTWSAGVGPAKDLFNLSHNPQYSLEVDPGEGVLWILLTRHITHIEDFRNNAEFIAVLVYLNNGQKVYYPYDPPPHIDGVRINSPHYLAKIRLPPSASRRYTLVISQFEKTTTLHFTVKVYSTLPFRLHKLEDSFKVKKKVTGEWSLKNMTAGGCANNRESYQENPRFQIKVDIFAKILIELLAPKEFQIGFDILSVDVADKTSLKYFKSKSSGNYRHGYVVSQFELLPGTYDVIPSTFRPGKEGSFFLNFHSDVPVTVTRTK